MVQRPATADHNEDKMSSKEQSNAIFEPIRVVSPAWNGARADWRCFASGLILINPHQNPGPSLSTSSLHIIGAMADGISTGYLVLDAITWRSVWDIVTGRFPHPTFDRRRIHWVAFDTASDQDGWRLGERDARVSNPSANPLRDVEIRNAIEIPMRVEVVQWWITWRAGL